MANTPVKIFEIKGTDWMRGFSRQTSYAYGGLFQSGNFNPFTKTGLAMPPLDVFNPSGYATTSGRFYSIVPFTDSSGIGKVYVHGSTKFYKIQNSNGTVTDETANIGLDYAYNSKGAIWKGTYTYARQADGDTRKIDVDDSGDLLLLTSANVTGPRIAEVGGDGDLYITYGSTIAKIHNPTGTVENTISGFSIQSGQIARDMVYDGRYLVIIADNNPSDPLVQSREGNNRCLIIFWDMVKATADIIYQVDDSMLIAIERIGSNLYVFGADNLYICSAGTYPVSILSFASNATVQAPLYTTAVTAKNGTLYWAKNNKIYAYGNPFDGNKKVFFQPFTDLGGTETINAICATSNKFYVAGDNQQSDPNFIYELQGLGSTYSLQPINTSPVDLGQRFQFAFAKMVLETSLASGASVALQIYCNNNTLLISDLETKNYSTDPGKQILLFHKTPNASLDAPFFEEISKVYIGAQKQAIKRFEIWGYPAENQWQT